MKEMKQRAFFDLLFASSLIYRNVNDYRVQSSLCTSERRDWVCPNSVDLLDPHEEYTKGQHGQQTKKVLEASLLGVVLVLLGSSALGRLLVNPQSKFAKSEERDDHYGRPDDLVDAHPSREEDDVQQDKQDHSKGQAEERTFLPSGLVVGPVGARHRYSLVDEFERECN
jgi:hypothetical protein